MNHMRNRNFANRISGVLDVIGLLERDFVHSRALVQTGSGIGIPCVLHEKGLILGLIPDYGLVEDGVLGGLGEDGEGWVCA